MATKLIVCLANSRKVLGRCVAGKEPEGGSWIRPVSSRGGEEVSEAERRYQDGGDPDLLDLIEIQFVGPRPHTHQSENWLLDPNHHWKRAGRATWKEVRELVDDVPVLWANESSTTHGRYDRVTKDEASRADSSLCLIFVRDLQLRVFAPGAAYGNMQRRVQAAFTFRKVAYRLRVTDPRVERRYLAQTDGSYEVGEACLTISLAEPHTDGYAYKLVAAIITPAMDGIGT